ncbi:hypothetical protein WBG78_28695 [Chryseolinea sp. T2]|uniref:hypothetical protein n=1 Tax=Chryseolinea sp. T2 TaxID=3129255 RepID=UPI003077F8AA
MERVSYGSLFFRSLRHVDTAINRAALYGRNDDVFGSNMAIPSQQRIYNQDCYLCVNTNHGSDKN